MWEKPDSEDLLPAFMQDAMGFCAALIVFLGLPAVTTCFLMRYYRLRYTLFPVWYMYTLDSIIKSQNVLYLIHIVPAFALRLFYGARMKVSNALIVAAFLFTIAVFLLYPVRAIVNPQTLKNIAFFVMTPPLLMAFFILRIHRLRASGILVILFFLGLLCVKYFK